MMGVHREEVLQSWMYEKMEEEKHGAGEEGGRHLVVEVMKQHQNPKKRSNYVKTKRIKKMQKTKMRQ